MVDAAVDLGLEDGQGRHRVGGLLPTSPSIKGTGEAGLLLVDQLLGVSRLEALSPLHVVRVPILVSSSPRDLVNPRQLSKQSIYDFRQSDGNFPETDQIREVFVVHEIGAPSQYYRQ